MLLCNGPNTAFFTFFLQPPLVFLDSGLVTRVFGASRCFSFDSSETAWPVMRRFAYEKGNDVRSSKIPSISPPTLSRFFDTFLPPRFLFMKLALGSPAFLPWPGRILGMMSVPLQCQYTSEILSYSSYKSLYKSKLSIFGTDCLVECEQHSSGLVYCNNIFI